MALRRTVYLSRMIISWGSKNAQNAIRLNKVEPTTSHIRNVSSQSWHPEPDLDYLSDPKNYEAIESNIKARNEKACIKTLRELLSKYNSSDIQEKEKIELKEKILIEALKMPNRSDPRLASYGEAPRVVETPGQKPEWTFEPRQFHEIAKQLDLLRTENLGNITGPRSYFFLKELAQLEQALIYYTVDVLEKKGFTLYSVPDLLNSRLIESCGMDTKSDRTQVHFC